MGRKHGVFWVGVLAVGVGCGVPPTTEDPTGVTSESALRGPAMVLTTDWEFEEGVAFDRQAVLRWPRATYDGVDMSQYDEVDVWLTSSRHAVLSAPTALGAGVCLLEGRFDDVSEMPSDAGDCAFQGNALLNLMGFDDENMTFRHAGVLLRDRAGALMQLWIEDISTQDGVAKVSLQTRRPAPSFE